jgi:DNA mismatch repair protein MutL
MGEIRKLPPDLVNKIAAGEVIERPASVVKELVENALDAGARRIEVTLEDGGKRLVRVADDGRGIAALDLPLAVESHATSKLATIEDLARIRTLGFRGEALASMGSVADLRVASRPAGEDGAEIRVRGGEAGPVRPAGLAPGTIVEVRDLFFNTPARRKFLRDAGAELRAAAEALMRLALGAPGVGFRLVHRGAGAAARSEPRTVLDARPTDDPLERIADLYGRDLVADLVPLEGTRGTARVTGFAALPRRTRGDASWQLATLWGRPIRDRIVAGAVREAYQGLVMTRRHPIVFLALELEPGSVDVNVHPAKLEVRFREPREVFGLVRAAILEAIEPRKEAPALRASGPAAAAVPARELSGAALVREPGPRWVVHGREPVPIAPSPSFSEGKRAFEGTPDFLQLPSGYLLIPAGDGFEVIDPHALHERILYEEWRERLATGAVEIQPLLVPALVDLTAVEEERLERAREPLAALGILAEPFGPQTAAIQAVPALLARGRRQPDWGALLRDLLGAGEDGAPGPGRGALLEALTARIACKAAVKLGERLSPEEVAALIAGRERARRSNLCPHGRPTWLRFTERDLEREFRR